VLIIQKSECLSKFLTNLFSLLCRVLLSLIRYLGNLPCPHCFIRKSQIRELGSKVDERRRDKFPRIDDEHRRNLVEVAQRAIYVQGHGITGKVVGDLLGPTGLVPTRVRTINLLIILILTEPLPSECFL
jgi:hypothetical protein